MRRIKFSAITASLIAAVGLLSGCAAEESASELVDADQLAGGSFSDISAVLVEGNSSENNSGESASNFTQGGSVQVTVPKSAEYCEAIVRNVPYDEEFVYKIKDIILGSEEIIPEISTRIFEGEEYPERCDYTFKKDGKYLKIDSLSYTISLSNEETALCQNLFTPPNGNNDGDIGGYSGLSEELDFCSRGDAVKQVRGIFEKIGVKTDKEADVYAFSQEEMQAKIDAEFAKNGEIPNYYFMGAANSDNTEMLTSYTVDKSREFYYIVLNAEYNDIPLYNCEYQLRSIKSLRIPHPQIHAIFTANGLEDFYIDEYRFDVEETKSVSKLLSPEDAAAVIREKYSDTGNVASSYIDTLELMYVYTLNESQEKLNIHELKMIPAWVCTMYLEPTNQGKKGTEIIKWKQVVMIDAQTGLEII